MDDRIKGPFRSTVFSRLAPAIFDSFTGSTFDSDVDSILCLKPQCAENVVSRRTSDTFQPMLSSTLTCDGGELYLNVSDEEEDDDGYFSTLHQRAKIPPPQHWRDEVREQRKACYPEGDSGVTEPVCDTSYEDTLYPEVQVKSVVVDRRVDWESKKASYVDSVIRHMAEKPTTQDVMTELLNLITDVTKKTSGGNGKHWQHPSDLTRRSFQRRFNNMTPRMSLREWQEKNSKTYKRFANVPKIFERNLFH